MTSANLKTTDSSSKIQSYQKPYTKLERLENKKIYYSDKYIYLDKKEFSIVWHNVGLFLFLHSCWFLGLYGVITMDPDFMKCAPISLFYAVMSGYGVTCGAHRLWSHRSYCAKLPLRIFYMIGHTIAGQNNLYVWSRDHRVHHKFSDTDGDPHNTNRGFFFAHMGWLMFKKHPDVLVKGGKLDLSDLEKDPVINFQRRYYYPLFFIVNIVLPMWVSMSVFGASFLGSFLYSFMLRYATALHSTWFVNSAAHMFGDKPYNEKMRPVENIFVSFFSIGEGFHNYHHSFPFDYATSEFSTFNHAKSLIDLMAKWGLAYNLKRASAKLVEQSKTSVTRRLYQKVDDEEEISNNLKTDYEIERSLNDHVNLNGNANKVLINDEIEEKIKKIKDKKPNGLHQINKNEDQNNNIFNYVLNETSQLKGR